LFDIHVIFTVSMFSTVSSILWVPPIFMVPQTLLWPRNTKLGHPKTNFWRFAPDFVPQLQVRVGAM